MLQPIIAWSLRRPLLVTAAAILLLVYGLIVLQRAKFDVFPEFVPAQAVIQTEAPGLVPEQVEQLVTLPIEQAVNGAAGVAAVRSESIQGLSVVTVVFGEGRDPYQARQVVAESLAQVAGKLPASVNAPKLEPLTSSTMDLLKVGFTSDKLTPMALRDLVDWTVRPRLLSAPGVARATVYGGQVRRIEVRARPDELAARDIGLSDLAAAVRTATGVTGGGFIDTPQQRILIEAHGQAATTAEIASGKIQTPDGPPIRIGDVAEVIDGPSPAFGDALIMGRPGVLVSMSSQYGANTLDTTRAVEAALAELKPALEAQGVAMRADLHRPANFIETAIGGITGDILIGAVLIGLVLFLFLRNPRAVLVSFVSIPLSLLAAILVLDRMGWTLNTMTLGGLAVALGVVVDDAVIDVENMVRRLRAAGDGPVDRAAIILDASLEVRSPVIYATFVVIAVLLPVLLLHGLQGSFFAPLAAAFILATLASLVVAIVLTPPLALLLLRNARLQEEPRSLTRFKDAHGHLLERLCRRPRLALAGAVAVAAAAAVVYPLLTTELLPTFREGHYVLEATAPSGTSLAVMRDYGERISRDILAIPGVNSIEQQIGRAEGGEDTWGPQISEFHIELKTLKSADQAKVEKQIHKAVDAYPGLQTELVTFLGDRIGESFSGETAALAVGVYGGDLDTLDKAAEQVRAIMASIPGAKDVRIPAPDASPTVRVEPALDRLAQYGLSSADVLATLQTAFAGTVSAQIYQGDRALDVAVTAAPDLREDPEAVGDLLLRSSSGVSVSLRQVAKVFLTDSRASIAHEGGRRRQVVTANPAPSEVDRFTTRAKAEIAKRFRPPPGVYLDYAGTAEGAKEARRELMFNTAVAAGGVLALLLLCFGDGRSTLLIVGATPFALAGGVAAAALSGGVVSLGSLVGFVTLFGVAARNAILLISHVDQLVAVEGRPWSVETVLLAARERLTPIVMTALVTALGLLPLAVETGQAGREIQGPMAFVILGGLATSTLMSLIVLPPLIWAFWRPRPPAAGLQAQPRADGF